MNKNLISFLIPVLIFINVIPDNVNGWKNMFFAPAVFAEIIELPAEPQKGYRNKPLPRHKDQALNNSRIAPKYPFLPHTVATENKELSSIIEKAYVRRFLSNRLDSSLTASKDNSNKAFNEIKYEQIDSKVKWLEWTELEDMEGNGTLFRSNIVIGNKKKRLIMHVRSHSWRGDIYTGYIVGTDKEQAALSKSIESNIGLKKFKRFYPVNSAKIEDAWEWHWHNIFKYKNDYYLIDEDGHFDRNDGIKKLYAIGADGESKLVSTFKVYKSLKDTFQSKDYPVYGAYHKNIQNIFGPGCVNDGTLHSHDRARDVGEYAASRAIMRPWIVSANDPSFDWYGVYHVYDSRMESLIKDWSLEGIWNLREYQTLQHHKLAAAFELEHIYIKDFGVDKSKAEKIAKQNVNDVFAAYIIVPNSYPDYRDVRYFEYSEKISKGTKLNWSQLKGDTISSGALASIAIDSVSNLKQALIMHPVNNIKNEFGKTLLMYAAHMNNYRAIEELLQAGAAINERTAKDDNQPSDVCGYDRLNRSALTYAAENASIEIIKRLVDAGADLNIKDSQGNGLEYYLAMNPRFTNEEKKLDIPKLITEYTASGKMFKPSFDCSKANTKIEKHICKDKTLSIYDRELYEAYSAAIKYSKFPDFDRKDQKNWLKKRNRECDAYTEGEEIFVCLAQQTRARTKYFHDRMAVVKIDKI